MTSESVCQVARSWVDVNCFHTRLLGVVCFAIATVREFMDTSSYILVVSTAEFFQDNITSQNYITKLHHNITSQYYITKLHHKIASQYCITILHHKITSQNYITILHNNIT
jgi:hypothetical protein